MRGYPALLASLLALFALPVMAGDFSAQLNQFFKARDPEHATGMNVVIRTPQAQWPLCRYAAIYAARQQPPVGQYERGSQLRRKSTLYSGPGSGHWPLSGGEKFNRPRRNREQRRLPYLRGTSGYAAATHPA